MSPVGSAPWVHAQPLPTLPDYFVKAMRAEPADDAPRLAAADWFQENGDEARAEFVRVQVTLAGIRPGDADFECPAEVTPLRPYPAFAHGPPDYSCRWCPLRARE